MPEKEVATCNFMLSPMTDAYEDVIMGAVTQLDTSRVWSETSRLGTVFRGKPADVLDNVSACVMLAWKRDVHMTADITLSCGCPCDDGKDCVLAEGNVPANAEKTEHIHFPADAKFALYPLGDTDYLEKIVRAVQEAEARGIYGGAVYQASTLSGDVQDIFSYFAWLFEECRRTCGHFVLQITVSVNSPTPA